MRAFLSQILLTLFIFVFAIPAPLFAQNWTAPDGPPLGNNVPSPFNVGNQSQTKGLGSVAPFTVNPSFGTTAKGVFQLEDALFNGPEFFISWIPSVFLDDTVVGESSVGPLFDIRGKFRYLPSMPDGSATTVTNGFLNGDGNSGQPQNGYVLTSIDSSGTAEWRPSTGGSGGGIRVTENNAGIGISTASRIDFAQTSGDPDFLVVTGSGSDAFVTFDVDEIIPPGVNAGDTLIWDTTCNCWTVGPVTNGGNLPPATAGQTIWYNGNLGQWQATSKIYHDVAQNLDRTTVDNELVVIDGSSRTIVGNSGLGLVQIQSPEARFINENVNFNDSMAWDQTVNFNNSVVKLKGPSTDPTLINPGTGRIPYSADDDGTFKWNENLTYTTQNVIDVGEVKYLRLVDDPGSEATVFVNEGISVLQDDVYVEDGGDVYLYGIEAAQPSQRGIGIVQPLCYVTTTKKVVTCYDDPVGEAPVIYELEPVYDTDYEILRTDIHNTPSPLSTYTFQSNQTVDIKICGAGGQGGGGGMGSINHGGGGGGGGGAGACQTLDDFQVNTGDVLSWDIGSGGVGAGSGTRKQEHPDFSGPPNDYEYLGTAGNNGEPTSLFIDYASDISGPVPVGQTQSGGLGGQRGIGHLLVTPDGPNISTVTGGYIGGQGANSNLANWHDGAPGCSQINIANCGYNQANWNSEGNGSNGGSGGDGENAGNTNLNPSQSPGSGGNPGTSYISDNCISGVICFQIGANGVAGDLGFGGGGGAGGAGMNPILLDGNVVRWPGGGNGAKGGSGYVRVSGILNSIGGSNAVVFDAPSSTDISYPVSAIPLGVQDVTLEVWGGAGGGGGVKTAICVFCGRKAGGGGGGGYIRIPDVPINQLGTSLLIKVGAGGVAGNSSGNSGEVTDGGQGGTSYIKLPNIMMPLLSAGGGHGGHKDTDNNNVVVGGGGQGGQPSTTGSPLSANLIQSAISAIGGSGSNGETGTGGNNSTGGNLSAGGHGAESNTFGTLTTSSTTGQNGRVRISWD